MYVLNIVLYLENTLDYVCNIFLDLKFYYSRPTPYWKSETYAPSCDLAFQAKY